MEKIKVNWLIPTQERNYNRVLASIWIRCLQLIPFLEDQGVECVINEAHSDANIYYFVRWQDEAAYQMAREAKNRGKKVIFDLVVNYYQECPPMRGAGVSAHQVEECLRMTEIADVITACSQFIADQARRHHDRVLYLPDSINPHIFCFYKQIEDFERKHLRLIWSGSAPKLHELGPVLPLIREYGFELVVITSQYVPLSDFPDRLFRRGYRFIKWRFETFPKAILQGELCISFRDRRRIYNWGHSNFKIGVMMAQGLPAVASGIPSYRELIPEREPKAGWICNDLEAWDRAFSEIVNDRTALMRRSQTARQVLQGYSTPKIVLQHRHLFDTL